MKRFALAALLVAPAFATPCIPSLSLDGVTLAQSCYNTPLVATPGSTWEIGFEDLPIAPINFSDSDANDLVSLVSFSNTLATFTYQGHLSVLHDTMIVDGLPVFDTFSSLPGATATAPITGLSIAFRARGIGYDATYALPSSNTVVVCIDGCRPTASVPEPSNVSLLFVGLLTIALVNLGLYRWALPSIRERRRQRIIQRVRAASSDPAWQRACDQEAGR